jgi:hypothetical protein
VRIDQASGNHHELIMSAFNSATYIDDKLDVQHEPLYDTLSFAAGATITTNTARFFSNVGSGSGKTLSQTNLTRNNQLPAPEAFSIFSIRFAWAANILQADLISILNGFALEFVIGKKPYNTGPLWHYNAGGGIFGTGTSISVNGNPGRDSMHSLAIPIVIENGADFEASLQGNNFTLAAAAVGGTGATLILLFDGLHARGVQ